LVQMCVKGETFRYEASLIGCLWSLWEMYPEDCSHKFYIMEISRCPGD